MRCVDSRDRNQRPRNANIKYTQKMEGGEHRISEIPPPSRKLERSPWFVQNMRQTEDQRTEAETLDALPVTRSLVHNVLFLCRERGCVSAFGTSFFVSFDREGCIVCFRMTSYRNSTQPVDSKKEEFRKYLEGSGVLEALTKALIGLFEEPDRPSNALDYLKRHLAVDSPQDEAIHALMNELSATKEALRSLQDRYDQLKSQLDSSVPEET